MGASRVRLHVLSWLLVLDFLGSERLKRWLWFWWKRPPLKRQVRISGSDRELAADFYCDPGRSASAAVLLTHGVIQSGKEDPRLVHFAGCLVRCGFAVLIPELERMKSLELEMNESRDIVDAFRFMVELDGVDRERAGLVAFSFGAGPTLSAAADPAIRDQVKFVVVFGGYFDPVNVIRYVTTGSDWFQGHAHTQTPGPYGREVFLRNIIRHVTAPSDRAVLEQCFTVSVEERGGDRSRPAALTRGGRAVYDLITNDDGEAVAALVERTDESVRSYLKSLSLEGTIRGVRARVFIAHGDADSLMPSTESLRLAAALAPESLGYVAILEIIGHVDPDRSKISLRQLLTVSLPALLRFQGLIRRVLGQQR